VAERVLDPDAEIAGSALPAGRLAEICAGDRQANLDLIDRAEALFPEELVGQRVRSFADHGRGNDGLVLGVGLLGEQRARQVELAARPTCIRAERADVGERCGDLVRPQRFAEGGHEAVEAADRPPAMRDRVPVRIGLASSEVAIGEVGKRHVETEQVGADAAAVAAVASGTGRRIGVTGGKGLLCNGRASEADRERKESHARRSQAIRLFAAWEFVDSMGRSIVGL